MRASPPTRRRSACLLAIAELFAAYPAALSFGAPAVLGAASLTMSAAADGIAVVGCGVLGTSLCKQLIENPKFGSRSGE